MELDEKKLADLVKALARGMHEIRGLDPDKIVPESGYSDAEFIPSWHKDREWALRFLAAYAMMNELNKESDGMKYSVQDIDQMREVVVGRIVDEMNRGSEVEIFNRSSVGMVNVEQRLRTYMQAGVTLEDLIGHKG